MGDEIAAPSALVTCKLTHVSLDRFRNLETEKRHCIVAVVFSDVVTFLAVAEFGSLCIC